MAEHALQVDLTPRVGLIRLVVTRIHHPVPALLGVPGERQLLQRARAGSVEIGADMISGAHHKIDFCLVYIGLFSLKADLITALVILAVPLQHRKVGVRRRVIIAVVYAIILGGIAAFW